LLCSYIANLAISSTFAINRFSRLKKRNFLLNPSPKCPLGASARPTSMKHELDMGVRHGHEAWQNLKK